jgi:small subunit ribosomal protein S6
VSEANTLYEAMYIINVSLTPEEVEQVVGRMENHVVENGGEVVGTRDFGRRRLAYKVLKESEGIYKILYFRGTGAVVDEVKHEFLLTETILRGTVVLGNPDCYVNEEDELIMPTTGTRRVGAVTAATVEAAEAAAAAAAAEAAAAAPVVEPVVEAEAAPDAEAAPEAEAAVEAEAPAEAAEVVAEPEVAAEPVVEEVVAEPAAEEAAEEPTADEPASESA